MTTRFRCSVAAVARDDRLAGTASRILGFLLVQNPGPWGPEAWVDNRLPDDLGPAIAAAAETAGIRPLLIRTGRREREEGTRIFLARTGPHVRWLETTVVDDVREVLSLDLAAVRQGDTAGLSPVADPIVCVCTHGGHDPCCARAGRPVAVALAGAAPPGQVWQCSHLGGDRFAGNAVILPEGLYFGRLDPPAALRVLDEYRQGRLDLDHFRGRTALPMPTQAAEIALRRHLAETRTDAVRFLDRAVSGPVTRSRFLVDDTAHEVQVHTVVPATRHRLTCHSLRDNPIADFVLDWIREAPPGRIPRPAGEPVS